MLISSTFLRKQLVRFRPLFSGHSLSAQRQGQNRIGSILSHAWRKKVTVDELFLSASAQSFIPTTAPDDGCPAVWVTPNAHKHEPSASNGALLYLHGGGYVTGELPYVKGVASMLAGRHQHPVLAPAYRLAPEHPHPAALEDALAAYRHLLTLGYSSNEITLIGESAGGGLCFSLCLKLKELHLPLPAGLITLSPWVDLTHSGESLTHNKENDPTLTLERLDFFADAYCGSDRRNPTCSPLFGDLSNLPPSLTIVGGDEILLSDAVRLHDKLRSLGIRSTLRIAPQMWHAYTLYPISESEEDHLLIEAFLKENYHGS